MRSGGKVRVKSAVANTIPRVAVAALAVIVAASIVLAALGSAARHPFAAGLSFGIASLAWLVAVRATRDIELSGSWIYAGAIALRLVALLSSLALSDDVYRYVWEGEVSLHGFSPYAFSPSAPELAALRAHWPALSTSVGHPTVSAAYPPIVQGVGALAAVFARVFDAAPEIAGVNFLRILFATCDVLVLVPLVALLRRGGRPTGRAVVWAWSPLLAFEFAGSGHFDSLGVLLLLTALVLLGQRSVLRATLVEVLGALALGAAILVKYLPIVALPWTGGRSRRTARAAPSLVVVGAGFLPFLFLEGAERGFFGGLTQYGLRWESTNLVFRFVEGACSRWFEPASGWSDPQRVARVVVGVVWLAWAVWVRARVTDRERGVALLVAGFLVLTPTLHPWYLAWIAPFVALFPSAAWLWLLAAAPLAYAPLAGWQMRGEWIEPAWLWPVIAIPFWVLLWRARGRGLRTR